VTNAAEDYYDLNQQQPAHIDVFAHLKNLPFTDCKLHITHETSSGLKIFQFPLPVCPQKFLAFESEQFVRNDRSVYSTGIQLEMLTATHRTFNESLVDVVRQMFPNSFGQGQGSLVGVLHYFSTAIQVRYELTLVAGDRLFIKLFASSSDSYHSDNLLNECLQTLMSNFNFILG